MARGVRVGVLVAVLAASLASLASSAAADPAADRSRLAQARVTAAAKLKAAEATDDELTAAVDTLAAAERAAQGTAQQTTRALRQAEADVADAETALARQHRAVANRAISAYVDQGRVQVFTGVKRPEDAARRLALAQAVQGRLVDAVDASRAAVGDLGRRRQKQAGAAKKAAVALRQAADARDRTAKAKADLEVRIDEFRKDVDALDAEQAALSQVLATASHADVAPPDPPAGQPHAPSDSGPSSSGFIWPVLGRLSSPFGPRWGRMHQGQDIAAPTGTPIKAPKSGTVIRAGWAGGYGNLTLIDHGGGIVTAYGHQSRFGVTQGDLVQAGQVIGYVGSTGHSTGPHLHFEVRVNGVARNPIPYLP